MGRIKVCARERSDAGRKMELSKQNESRVSSISKHRWHSSFLNNGKRCYIINDSTGGRLSMRAHTYFNAVNTSEIPLTC